jgi:L-ribulose-5-phosphate 3-epimerase
MYRRSVITDEISQDFDAVLDVARAFSLDALEIRSVWDTRVDQLDDAAVRRLKEATEKAGMVICGVAPPFYKCDVDSPEERREHLEILRRAIDVGQRLGTNIVRTFTFWKKHTLADVWDELIDSYQKPIEIARETGVVLAVENEAACMIGLGSDLGRFVRQLNRPEVKALWDPCNAFYEDAAERPFPDGYLQVRDLLVHVHLKDAVRDVGASKPRLTPLGDGSVDVAGQLAALIRDGYNGFVSLETHWRPDALDEQTTRLPGGRAFSEKAAVATIYCLKKWDVIQRDLARQE